MNTYSFDPMKILTTKIKRRTTINLFFQTFSSPDRFSFFSSIKN